MQGNAHQCQMVRDMVLLLSPWTIQLYGSSYDFCHSLINAEIVNSSRGKQECKPGTWWLCLRFHLLPFYTAAVPLLLSLLNATCQAHASLIVCPLGCYQMNLTSWRGGAGEMMMMMMMMMMCKARGLGFGKPATPAPPHREWMSYEMERRSKRSIQFSCKQKGAHNA